MVALGLFLVMGLHAALGADVTLSELKEELSALKETTAGLERKLEASERRNVHLADTVTSLKEHVTRLDATKDRRQLLANIGPEIGFMATATNDEHNLHLDQTIIYNQVITNIGNAYDPTTGIFAVPVTGTYLFNFNVMAADGDYVEASLMVNGNHIVHALSDHQGTSINWDMGTTNVILRVNEGDQVKVGIQWPDRANSVHGNKFNTFSGYLLRPL